MFQRILVCSDGSDHALKAARVTGEIARRCGSEITLLSVLDIAAATAPYMGQWETVICTEDLFNCASEAQARAIADTAKVLKTAGVDYTSVSETGYPVDVITDTAEREQCDLIILGSRGGTAWEALLLGSVADGVARHAHCPVLIVRGGKFVFEKILLASDGSKAACRAAETAGQIARTFDTGVTVLNVLGVHQANILESASTGSHETASGVRDSFHSATQEAIKHCGAWCNAVHEVGHPAQVIIDYANTHNADLIVIGSRGLGAFKSLLLGSVSNRIMHYANKSVLIVH